MNHIKKTASFLLVFALIFMSAFCLVACNKQQDDDGDIVRNLYIYTIQFEEDDEIKDENKVENNADSIETSAKNSAFSQEGIDGLPVSDKVATVYLTFSDTGKKVEGASVVWRSQRRKDGEFYFVSTTSISSNPQSIFSAVRASIPQEDLVHNDVRYNRLKVVLRYDTIYKSIKSDGEVTRKGRTYTHIFALDENLDDEIFTLEMRSPNSANWYATLVGCALIVVLIAIVATLSVKGAKWQKTKTKE